MGADEAPFLIAVHAGVGQHSKHMVPSYKEGERIFESRTMLGHKNLEALLETLPERSTYASIFDVKGNLSAQ